MGNEEEMSWQTADLPSGDTTDVLAADTTDVLPADTTHVLPADKFGVGNPTFTDDFEVLDPDLGCLVLENNFPRTCSKNNAFFTVWEPGWYTKADPAGPPDPDKMSHRGPLWP